jgi:hypothetical protein
MPKKTFGNWYQALIAEPTIEYRTKEEQHPPDGRDQSSDLT